MTKLDLMRSARRAGLVLVLLAGVGTGSVLAQDYSFDSDELTVHNMIGRVVVTQAEGDRFEVRVDVRGEDAGQGLVEMVTEEGRKARLAVKFPIDQEDDYVYPELGRNSKTTITYEDQGDHGGSWLKKVFAGMTGKRVTVRGHGRGLEVWADITVAVPRGAFLTIENRVGAVSAADVEADLVLDTGSGSVEAANITGDLVADTGSGPVTLTGVRGEVLADTGSGSVEIRDAVGDEIKADTGSGSVFVEGLEAATVLIDTGSGSVQADQVVCRKLTIDTGSGGVKARGIEAEAALIDTGSGSVVLQLDRMGEGEYKIDTGSGSIDLVLPGDASARITADTSSGGVHNEFEGAEIGHLDRDEMELVVGGGEARVILDAGSGSITVSKR
ncbi:MAG: DUF4097 domain-containing protein [Candidatus Krumholzibacteriia bacterium]